MVIQVNIKTNKNKQKTKMKKRLIHRELLALAELVYESMASDLKLQIENELKILKKSPLYKEMRKRAISLDGFTSQGEFSLFQDIFERELRSIARSKCQSIPRRMDIYNRLVLMDFDPKDVNGIIKEIKASF